MERFIHQQNLELYRKLLADPNDKDEARHQMLLKLLADEVAWDRQPPPVKKKGPPAALMSVNAEAVATAYFGRWPTSFFNVREPV
jgi:hypothetical protein